MTNPTKNDVSAALRKIELSELPESHPRRLAQQAVARYRQGNAIDHRYKFEDAPAELRQIVYSAAVRYHYRHSLWSRLWRR